MSGSGGHQRSHAASGVAAPTHAAAALATLLRDYWHSARALLGELARALGPAGTLLAWWAVRLAAVAGLIAFLVGLLLLSTRSAKAQARPAESVEVLRCLDAAAAERGLDPKLLRAVARAESNLNPRAVNRSHVARTGTADIGLLQINSGWLPALRRFGIRERDLYDGCTNARVGAWLLADALARHGNTWNAVGSYNAACTELKGERCARARQAYAWTVFRRMDAPAPTGPRAAAGPAPTRAAEAVHMGTAGLFALTALTALTAPSAPAQP